MNQLEKQFKKRENLNLELNEAQTIQMAISTLQNVPYYLNQIFNITSEQVISSDFKATDLEVAVVSKSRPKFTKISAEEIEEHLNAISTKDQKVYNIIT